MATLNSTRNAPRILMCWGGRPGYVPAPQLSPDQVTVYSHHDRENPGTVSPMVQLADRQDYDIEAVAEQLGGKAQFDLVCVSSAATPVNQPRNLGAFTCPTVLLVGDTHHGIANPIRFVLDYLRRESYDIVMSMYNRDHNKWFAEFTDARIGWIAGLTVQDVPTPFVENRNPTIAFVGSWRNNHLRRKSFINKIRRDKLPYDHQKLSRAASAPHYAKSLVSFNCSLNGDLNMRVHEILSSGGVLLTDRLSAASGIDEILVEGEDYLAYDGYPEFREHALALLGNPQRAVQIARRGLETYRQTLSPSYLAPRFVDWALHGDHSEYDYPDRIIPHPGVEADARLQVYEAAQRTQLWTERSDIACVGSRASAIASDLAALPRVRVSSFDDAARFQEQSSGGQYQLVVIDSGHSLLDPAPSSSNVLTV